MFVKIQNGLTIAIIFMCAWLYTSKEVLQEKYNIQSNQLSEARTTINHMTDEINKSTKLNEANSRKIQSLINQSTKTQEELTNAIKDKECTNINLPSDVINKLRERANSINSPTNTQ